MTIRMYADRKKLNLENIDVTLRHDHVHAADCADCEKQTGLVDKIEKTIKLEGDLTDAQRQRILEIADMCPVHKTLHNEIKINSSLV